MRKSRPNLDLKIVLLLAAALSFSCVLSAPIDTFLGAVPSFGFHRLGDLPSGSDPSRVLPGEVLKEFGLQEFSRWSVVAGDGKLSSVTLDVYEMLDPQGAFGLFTTLRSDSENAEVLPSRVDALARPGDVIFWRGRFLFLLPRSNRPAVDFVPLIDALADAEGEINLYPMTVVQLPIIDLDPKSIEFFLGPDGLARNPKFPPPLLSEVGFDRDAEVTSARYRTFSGTLFLLGYPTADIAEEYFQKIHRSLGSYFSPEGIYLKRSGLIVALFVGPEDEANRLLDQVKYSAKVKWIYDKQPNRLAQRKRGEIRSFFGTVTAAMIFTALFILVVLAAGCVAGLIRYEMLRRFPWITKRDEMIRLDLSQ